MPPASPAMRTQVRPGTSRITFEEEIVPVDADESFDGVVDAELEPLDIGGIVPDWGANEELPIVFST